MPVNNFRIRPLAQNFVTLFESPDPANIYGYSPGLAQTATGRIIATIDLGGPLAHTLPGPKFGRGDFGWCFQGQIFTSDDHGQTWTHRGRYPFMHARPFVAGNSVYILGQAGDLMIIRSDDHGETWSLPVPMTSGQFWHQAPSNVHYANGKVYLVMERRITTEIAGWYVGEMAPVLMRARETDDLCQMANWTLASEISLPELIPNVKSDPTLEFFGVPFFPCPYPYGTDPAPGRNCAPMGWLETNVVQFTDPDHYWFDPTGRTFHLWMRAHTGGTGYAMVLKVIENADGTMTTLPELAPSGKKILFVPCPGGQLKFHVLFDSVTRLFWLVSNQATDSLTRADRLPDTRYNLPNNERHRLALHFSKNMVDWCFAGMVTLSPSPKAARNYPTMLIDGHDLHILSRSGDERASNAHNGNLITFHTVPDFRELVY
jgi:hypothetical protein